MSTFANSLSRTVSVARWQLFVLVGTSGFAVGTLIARAQSALGL